jgi:hypothetical protein
MPLAQDGYVSTWDAANNCGVWKAPSGTLTTASFGSPSVAVALTTDPGTATTALRSDARLALDQSIAPTWTGAHVFTAAPSVKVTDAAIATLNDVLTLAHESSGTPAAGFGASVLFNLKSSTTLDRGAVRVGALWTQASDVARSAAWTVQTVESAGALTERLRVSKSLSYVISDEFRIGSSTNAGGLGNASRLFVFGGANGCNIDVMGDGTVSDQATIELESSDYSSTFASVRLQYYGVNGSGTTFGVANHYTGVLGWQSASHALIGTDNSTPIQVFINSTEAARFGSGFMVGTTTDPGAGVVNVATGFRIANAATGGNYLRGNGTNFVSSAIQFADLPSSDDTTLAASSSTTLPTQHAVKTYVDNSIVGLKWKQDVVAASVSNVSVSSAPSSIDGVTLNSGDRVLLKNQTTGSENGVYVFNGAASALTRATDGNTGAELVSATFPVRAGTVNQDTWWTCINDSITLGTTALVFTQTGGAGTYVAGAGLTLTGNSFSVATAGVTNAMLAGSIAASKLIGTDIATVGTVTAGAWQATRIGLAYGGTNADLSGSGGTSQVLRQSTAGGAVTVSQLAASDLSNGTSGTGAVALVNNPAFGAITTTTVNKVTITQPATGSTLTISDGKTLTASNTVTLAGASDGLTGTIPATGTFAMGAGTNSVISVSATSGANHTHAITSSSNPGAAASLLATDASGYLTTVRYTATDYVFVNAATANLYLKDTSTGWQASSTTVISPQANNSVRSTSFTSGLVGWSINAAGDAELSNVTVRGAIRSSVLLYNAVLATNGSQIIVKSAAKLKADVPVPSSPTYGTTTVTIDAVDQDGLTHAASQLFVVNDILRLTDGLTGTTWFKVTAVSDQTSFWRYTASIQAGANNVTYRAGLGVLDYGQSGQGFIVETADQANAPYIQMATHAASFSSADASGTLAVTPRLRIGNLNGSYGYAADTYGFGSGKYGAASESWLTVDSTNGLRVGNNTTVRAQIAADGSAFFGNNNLSISSGGVLTIGSWTVNASTLTGTSTTLDSAGKLTLGSGNNVVILDANDATYRIVVGNTTYASAPFRVDKTGAMTSTSGSIGGWNLNATQLSGGAIAMRSGVDPTTNLATNPTFEGGNVGWSGMSVVNSPGFAPHSGTWYLNSTTANEYGLNTLFTPCNPGDSFYAEGWVTSTGGSPGYVVIGWYDSTQTLISYSQSSGTTSGLTNITATAPASTAYVRVGFRSGPGTPGWRFDDVVLNSSATNNKIFVGAGTYNNTNTAFYVDGSGQFSLKDKFTWDGSTLAVTGALTATSGSFTGTVQISGASGALAVGSTPPTSATAGTGLWLDRTGLFALNAGTLQVEIGATNGALTAGGGNVTLDSNGVTIASGSGTSNKLTWTTSGSTMGQVWALWNSSPFSQMHVEAFAKPGVNNGLSAVYLEASNNSGLLSSMYVVSYDTSHATLPNKHYAIAAVDGLLIDPGATVTSSPGYTLTVSGTAYITGNVRMDGSVGIGTSSPSAMLDVRGGVTIGVPTGGDKGTGSVNVAGDLFKNGTAYTNPHGGFEYAYTGKVERYADRMAAMGLEDYRALSLEDLEAYTREHFHFPYLGDEEGNGLFGGGERLLLITEELAVHLFDLHHQVKNLRSQLQDQFGEVLFPLS